MLKRRRSAERQTRPSKWRLAMDDWWQARIRPVPVHHLTQRNVYILPTRAGWFFAAMLLLLLLASINEQLSLGYALTFLLAGAGAVSLHLTHRNLNGLQLSLREGRAVHAGQPAAITVVLHNDQRTRYGVGLRTHAAPETQTAWVDMPPGEQLSVELQWLTTRRGHWPVPLLLAETRYPFGLFRAWTLWRPAGHQWVYPTAASPVPPLPAQDARQDPSAQARHRRVMRGGDEAQVRPYRQGDPMHQIHWKKTAQAWLRGADGVSKEAISQLSEDHLLRWTDTGMGNQEDRLSRLTAWVLLLSQRNNATGLETTTPFGMELPDWRIPPGHGPAHTQRCLTLLATWRLPP